MFGTIRKHQTWLWAVIITLTIISFVVFFSPYSKMNDTRGGSYGRINGHKVTEQDFLNARREVDLHYFFMTGRWPEEDKRNFDPLRETYQWLLIVQKQDDLGVHVDDTVMAQMTRQLLRPFERMGVTSPQLFIDRILTPRGYKVDDLERFIRHYIGIQEMISTVGLAGKLVTPQEARSLYERERQELSTEAALFNASNYLASVSPTPDALALFYTNRLANYRIPERLQVSYVRFNVTNYLAQVEADLKTNINEIVEANYQRMGSNYFADAKSPEEAKARIRTEVLRSQAMAVAKRKGLDFASILFDMKPVKPANLQELARSNNLPVAVSQPFDREDGPKDLEGGPDFAKAAFKLTDEEPFGGPVMGQDGAYVFALNKRIPSELPPLSQIRDRVLDDYKHNQSMMLARQAALAFQSTVTNGLAQGKSFDTLCGDAKVKTLTLPPFSLSTRSLTELDEFASLDQVKQAAFATAPGRVSQLVPTSQGAMLLFVKAKLPVDEAKVKTDLPEFTNFVRRRRQEEAFNIWLSREAERALRDTPVARAEKAPPANMTPAQKAAKS